MTTDVIMAGFGGQGILMIGRITSYNVCYTKLLRPFTDVDSEYYLHFQVVDKPGVLSKIAGVLGNHQISISSVIQKGRRKESAVAIFIVTHHAKEKDMRAALEETDRLPVVLDRTRMIRIENNL